MKHELETPGYQPTATMDAKALRQMFELDLDGYAARKIKVQPRELRCLRIAERPAKRHEKGVTIASLLSLFAGKNFSIARGIAY